MWDAVWDKENHTFREWCKTSYSFRIGRTFGLGSDDQELIFFTKQGVTHDVFMEFQQDERPMSMPPMLFNAASAFQLANEAIASAEDHEAAGEEQKRLSSNPQEEGLQVPGSAAEEKPPPRRALSLLFRSHAARMLPCRQQSRPLSSPS